MTWCNQPGGDYLISLVTGNRSGQYGSARLQNTAALQESSIAWCQTLYDWTGKILATKGFPFSCHLQNLSCLFHLPWFEPCMLGKEWKPVNNCIIVWFTQLQGLLNYNYQYSLGLLVLEFCPQANKGKEEGKEQGTEGWSEEQREGGQSKTTGNGVSCSLVTKCLPNILETLGLFPNITHTETHAHALIKW